MSRDLANVKHEFSLWFGTCIPWLIRAGHGNTHTGRIIHVFLCSQACVLGRDCRRAGDEQNWMLKSQTLFLICIVALKQFKATVVVNSLTVIVCGESFHAWLDCGAAWLLLVYIGKCEVVMLIGKGPDASKKSWSYRLCSAGFDSALTFWLVNCLFFFFKAMNPILGCFPINKEYYFITQNCPSCPDAGSIGVLVRAGTLRVLTLLYSIHCNLPMYLSMAFIQHHNSYFWKSLFFPPLWSTCDIEAAADWQLIFLQWFAEVFMQMTCGFSAK